MGVMKKGNILPRVEPTSLSFRTSVLTIIPPMFPDFITLPMVVSMQLLAWEISADYYTHVTQASHQTHFRMAIGLRCHTHGYLLCQSIISNPSLLSEMLASNQPFKMGLDLWPHTRDFVSQLPLIQVQNHSFQKSAYTPLSHIILTLTLTLGQPVLTLSL